MQCSMNDTATLPVLDARTRILDAAETLVTTRGVGGLTIEAAAREGGIS